MNVREFSSGVQITCEAGHRISANREPVEHGIVECRHSRIRRHDEMLCGARLWVLQLDGGRRLTVALTEEAARLIRAQRMTAAAILDLLGLIVRKAG